MHLGQVGHPSPEPVKRTRPPVTTMTMFMTNETIDQPRNAYGPRTTRSTVDNGPPLRAASASGGSCFTTSIESPSTRQGQRPRARLTTRPPASPEAARSLRLAVPHQVPQLGASRSSAAALWDSDQEG